MKSKVIMTVSTVVGFVIFGILTSAFESFGLDAYYWALIPAVILGTLTHWILSGKGLTSKSNESIGRIKGRLTWWYWLIGSIIFGVITFLSIPFIDKVPQDWYWQAPTVIVLGGLILFFISYFLELYNSKLELILTDKSRRLLNKKGYDLLSHKTGFIVIKAEEFNSKYEDMTVYYNGGIEGVYEWAQSADYLPEPHYRYKEG